MTLLQILLIVGCIILGVFFLMDAAFYYLGSSRDLSSKRIQARLSGAKKIDNETIRSNLRRKKEGRDKDTFFLDAYFKDLLQNADSTLQLSNIYMLWLCGTLVLAMLGYYFVPFIPILATLFLSLFISVILIAIVLKRQAANRLVKFAEQFPDAIELIVRSLRVGQPFNRAILSVANEMKYPIAKEFHITAQEIAYGRELPEALDDLQRRVSLPDLQFFVVAVQIHHESGGNLAEILENLSKIIRGRFRLMRKVAALTIEGRFSAWFLSGFPLLMIFVMNTINPGYYTKVSDYEYFPLMCLLTVFLLIVNVIAMRIMTKLEV